MNESHRLDMPLNELCQNYLEENPRVRSKHTMQLVKISVQHFQDYLGRAATLADFTNKNLVGYMERRKEIGRRTTNHRT